MKTQKTTLEAKLAEIEATITYTKPYAELAARLGLDINESGQGINQGHADRARLFCESVARRQAILELLEDQE